MRVELLEAMLQEQSARPRENPFEGVQGIQWRDTFLGRVVQILTLPLVAILMAVLGVVEVVRHFAENRNRRKTQRRIRNEIDRLQAGHLQVPEIEPKTIAAVWHAYGVRAAGLSHEQELQLLGQWIERLYGPETRRAIDLEGRVEAIQESRAAWARERPDTLVTYAPITSTIVRDISGELPEYDGCDRVSRV